MIQEEVEITLGRKSYLGGSSIESARTNPHHLENSAPEPIAGNEDHIPVFSWAMDDDLKKELEGLDFDFLVAFVESLEHAFLHGDITAIPRAANDDEYFENYLMRLANRCMTGRSFDRKRGKIVVVRTGNLGWLRTPLLQIVEVSNQAARDYNLDPLDLSNQFRSFLEDGEAK